MKKDNETMGTLRKQIEEMNKEMRELVNTIGYEVSFHRECKN